MLLKVSALRPSNGNLPISSFGWAGTDYKNRNPDSALRVSRSTMNRPFLPGSAFRCCQRQRQKNDRSFIVKLTFSQPENPKWTYDDIKVGRCRRSYNSNPAHRLFYVDYANRFKTDFVLATRLGLHAGKLALYYEVLEDANLLEELDAQYKRVQKGHNTRWGWKWKNYKRLLITPGQDTVQKDQTLHQEKNQGENEATEQRQRTSCRRGRGRTLFNGLACTSRSLASQRHLF